MKAQLLLFAATCLASHGAGTSFPSDQTCSSPNLHWTIRCVSATDSGGGVSHMLLMTDAAAKKEAGLWVAGRGCDVLWCTDSQRLALTDWTGSNVSEIYLIDVTALREAKPLEVKGVRQILEPAELEGHRYYEALAWEGAHRLLIRIFGHTDENPSHGFTYQLSVDTITGEAKLVNKSHQEPNEKPAQSVHE